MPFDFAFCSVQTSKQVKQTIDFLARQDLGYPNYDKWVQKVEAELFSGYKRAALAYSNGILVGDIVWQEHKQLPRIKELKNLRISSGARGRCLARFLLRQAEVEDSEQFDAFLGDARETQVDLIGLMRDMGYMAVSKLNLYEEGRKDVVLFKCFDKGLHQKNLIRIKNYL
jgi:hypothetical protein